MTLRIITVCWLSLILLPWQVQAQTAKNTQERRASVQSFVREFYTWYVPKVLKHHAGPAWDLALKYRSHVFSVELFRALQEDSEAQAKVTGEITGLDFDPFLNTQDPCEHYDVGEAVPAGEAYRVAVFSVCSGKKHEEPDVIAEVGRQNGHWVFVNFVYENLAKQYPNSANLLATLKLLQEERGEPKPKP